MTKKLLFPITLIVMLLTSCSPPENELNNKGYSVNSKDFKN